MISQVTLRDPVSLAMLEALLKHPKTPTRKAEEYLTLLIKYSYNSIIK
jgi:hypothetical protein